MKVQRMRGEERGTGGKRGARGWWSARRHLTAWQGTRVRSGGEGVEGRRSVGKKVRRRGGGGERSEHSVPPHCMAGDKGW